MKLKDIGQYRLHNQQISHAQFNTPEEIVMWLGAVQAQDYLAALWAIGIRTQHAATETYVEQALNNRSIVRTWPLRGTLHLVSATDVHWMLELTAPRLLATHANRLKKEFELDKKVFIRCKKVLARAFKNVTQLTRDVVYKTLDEANISVANQRGLHILWRLAQEKFICFGPRKAKHHTFVLLDEWIPKTKSLSRDESLAELARRYFTSHGPATLQDFTWWSGLSPNDASAGLEMIKSKLIKEKVAEQIYWMSSTIKHTQSSSVHLLPGFDEFMISYADRSASLDVENFGKLVSTSNGIFNPTIVSNGKVVGTWRRTLKKNFVEIEIKPFTSFSKVQSKAIDKAVKQYGVFLNKKVEG